MIDGDLLAVMEGMAGKIERLEVQLQTVHAALETLTEIGMLTFAATGTSDTLPDEVIDAPITERVVKRNWHRLKIWRGTPELQQHHADLLRGGAKPMEAELRRLRAELPDAKLAARVRLTLQIGALDAAMKQSFEREMNMKMKQVEDRDQERQLEQNRNRGGPAR